MEYNSVQSRHLPSESFERWFAAIPLLENLNLVNLIQQRFCMAFRALGFYAGQVASYSMPIFKQDISLNLLSLAYLQIFNTLKYMIIIPPLDNPSC
ncbi:MAG: hypothetical protein QW139_01415 [Candidatus Micrarchaeaceae archaeon]